MRNSMKVAKWEIKRNVKNKSFLIGLFLTPIIMIGFGLIGGWISGSSDDTEEYDEEMTIFVNDELDIFVDLEETVTKNGLPWSLAQTDLTEDEMQNELTDNENVAYLYLDEEAISDGAITVYTSDEVDPFFINQVAIF